MSQDLLHDENQKLGISAHRGFSLSVLIVLALVVDWRCQKK